ncbi:MAG: prolyl aminopeptidase [Gammaproteobacteria bacterium]|nr:MAG: prolyl aminopeptidase [Gammaproteobacteria bacterium]RKZ38579.1 MAG: prolyl aminopeptidase [Gammaproteobacteria bacterium]RKZ73546.1 MAG: prolyl aminopeptidase [Gammaproteobacteria bacterium]
MKTLYPDIEPYATHQIAVKKPHVLMVEECGNPDGIPVVFLHGGPGSHCKPYHRCFFNPNFYRVILFDQRGAGRSTPNGCLQDNTTWDLLADMEVIRKQLNIKSWVIFGGSWGSTLGLLYAQQHPESVLALILRGIFLARECDLGWFYQEGGVKRLFPQQWEFFAQGLSEQERENPLAAYYEQLTGNDTHQALMAALAWSNWAGCIVSHGQFAALTEPSKDILNEARIECQYMYNRCFIEENQLLRDIDKVANLQAVLIHGQRDLVCPADSSYLLVQNWHAAQLKMIATGGHLASDVPEMLSALVEATDGIAKMLPVRS